jgi:hypothetical protein
MPIGSHAVEGIFAIIAGVVTLVKGEAWIGRLPATVVVKGPATTLIGVVAIGLGIFFVVAK